MSAKVIESPPVLSGLRTTRERPRETAGGGLRAAVPVVWPPLAALAAWLAHYYLPNRQLPPKDWLDNLPVWQHPYSVLLLLLFAVTTVLAVLQVIFGSLANRASASRALGFFLPRRLVRHWAKPEETPRPWSFHAPLMTGAIGLLALWDLLTLKLNWLKLPTYPGPETVFAGMVDDRSILFQSAWHSLLLLMTGYGGGVAVGLVTGVLIGWFPRARYWGMPIVKLVGPIPATALLALVMTLSTKSFICGAALIAFAVWFPVTMLTSSGIANVPRSYFDVARTLGAGRLYLIFRVAIPAAMPSIFFGLFMGLGASFLVLSVAETTGVGAGLGWYLKWQQGYMEFPKVYGVVIIMSVFFSSILTVLFKVRDWVLAWQKGTIRW